MLLQPLPHIEEQFTMHAVVRRLFSLYFQGLSIGIVKRERFRISPGGNVAM